MYGCPEARDGEHLKIKNKKQARILGKIKKKTKKLGPNLGGMAKARTGAQKPEVEKIMGQHHVFFFADGLREKKKMSHTFFYSDII